MRIFQDHSLSIYDCSAEFCHNCLLYQLQNDITITGTYASVQLPGMALDSLVCKYCTHINRISLHNVMQQALHNNVVSTGAFPTVPYMDQEFQHTWQSNAVPCIWELLPSLKADIMGIEVINNKSKNLCI